MEELYEELPGEQEELYEDLPDSAYNDYPSPNATSSPYSASGYQSSPQHGAAPPPLPPSSSIPQHRPGAPPLPTSAPPSSAPPLPSKGPAAPAPAPPPSLPTRSPSTQLTLKAPAGKKKDVGKKKPPPPKSSAPAGIDMNEILKLAKNRPRNFDDLEKKKDEDKPAVAPWANQLRRTPQHKASENAKQAAQDAQEDDVPEFIKKRRTLSVADADDDGDSGGRGQPSPPPAVAKKPSSPSAVRKAPPPAPGVKPRQFNPGALAPKVPIDAPTTGEKPSWQKQRERQVALSQETKPAKPVPASKPGGKPPPPGGKPTPAPPPGGKPVPAGKPPLPDKGSPAIPPRNTSNESNFSVTPKPRPKPTPRKIVSPPTSPPMASPNHQVNGITNGTNEQASPPRTPSSIRDRARTLEISMGIETPPESPAPQQPAPPTSKPPPPKPERRDSRTSAEPPLPSKPAAAPPPRDPPSFSKPPPPPPETPPPPPDNPPPSSTPTLPPPIPSKAPPTTVGIPTPPQGSVMKFRRLPLRPVDIHNPPSLPSKATKPPWPLTNGSKAPAPPPPFTPPAPVEEDEEIYDDALPADSYPPQPVPVEEELYDDVGVPPSQSQSNLPPAPSLPPPNKPPEANGTAAMIEQEELYDDVAPNMAPPLPSSFPSSVSSTSLGPAPPPPNASSSSLAPPSPQHPPGVSPTMGRKQKLTKEEKKRQKELEKLEKENKKKSELRSKNRAKGLKAHKQFNLPSDVQHLFTVEVTLDHTKTKDHLACESGEILFVLLIAHEKMNSERYLVEKEDGTIGFVKKSITQRVNYNSITTSPSTSALSQPPPPIPAGDFPEEDIYESLPQDEPDFSSGPPPLPSQAIPNLPRPNPGAQRFPPPMQAPPPPPGEPEETYEYLPDEN